MESRDEWECLVRVRVRVRVRFRVLNPTLTLNP